jgi:mono/diheme cytochrome c family protein
MNRSTVASTVCAALVVALSIQAAHATTGGLYTSQQAVAGAKAYATNCARCHGANLEGVSGPRLKGPDLTAPARKESSRSATCSSIC